MDCKSFRLLSYFYESITIFLGWKENLWREFTSRESSKGFYYNFVFGEKFVQNAKKSILVVKKEDFKMRDRYLCQTFNFLLGKYIPNMQCKWRTIAILYDNWWWPKSLIIYKIRKTLLNLTKTRIFSTFSFLMFNKTEYPKSIYGA